MPYLKPPEIETEMDALHALAPLQCFKTALPNPTVSEGVGPTTYSFLKIANGTGAGRVAVLAVAGMHAREWAQPDAVLSFARKLLLAYKGKTAFVIAPYTDAAGNTYSPAAVPPEKIKRMVDELDILLLPCANPDGRAFSQANPANNDWRKNRAPRSVAADPATVGVDLNRNFDIAWDYDVFYNAAFAATAGTGGGLSASKDPAAPTFIGKAKPAPNAAHPASEPEVRNLVWLLDNHPVTYSIDLHSWRMLLMHPWGIEQNGSVPAQNFSNAAFDGKRDGTLGKAYSEFFPNAPTRLLERHAFLVGVMGDAVRAATGRKYKVGGIADIIYPATGSFTDFHFSRQFTIAGSPPIHAFAAEFGDVADNFWPDYTNPNGFPKIEREVHAVLITLLEQALSAPPLAPSSGGGGGGGGGTGSGTHCLFSAAAADLLAAHGWLDTLRRGRAALLGERRTSGAMLALDRGYRRLSHLLVPYIVERPWAKNAVRYGLLAPVAAITRVALNETGRT